MDVHVVVHFEDVGAGGGGGGELGGWVGELMLSLLLPLSPSTHLPPWLTAAHSNRLDLLYLPIYKKTAHSTPHR